MENLPSLPNSLQETPNNGCRKKFAQLKDLYWCFRPVLLSHHPDCEYYINHTLNFGKKKYCIGCYVGIPSSIITLIVGYLTHFFNNAENNQLFLLGGFFLSFYLLSLIGFTNKKSIKIVTKIPIGIGSAFIIAGLMQLNIILIFRILLVIIFSQGALVLLGYLRYLKMKNQCLKCEYKQNWKNCPGFEEIFRRLSEKGFMHLRNESKM